MFLYPTTFSHVDAEFLAEQPRDFFGCLFYNVSGVVSHFTNPIEQHVSLIGIVAARVILKYRNQELLKMDRCNF